MSPVDTAMLDLFRMEAQTHATAMRRGLDDLNAPNAPLSERERQDACKALARSAQSLKGAARIIGLDRPAQLAAAMETMFAQNEQKTPGTTEGGRENEACPPSTLPLLGQCVDIFLTLADLDAAEYDGWLERMAEAMDDLHLRLLASPAPSEPSCEHSVENTVPNECAPCSEPVHNVQPEPAPAPTAPPTDAPTGSPSASSAPEPVNIADASLLDLFVIEAQTHGQSLDTGLVELEKDQQPEKVEPLMRAAHSLKGAARIVGLDNVVTLAHAMEDVLEACRKQELVLTDGHVDLLLKANDLFLVLGRSTADALPALLADQAAESRDLADKVRASLQTPPAPSCEHSVENPVPNECAPCSEPVHNAQPEPAPAPTAPPTPQPGPAGPRTDGVVRVSAQNLTRIMGLAGECLVEARSLFPFLDRLNAIRREQLALSKAMGTLREALAGHIGGSAGQAACAAHLPAAPAENIPLEADQPDMCATVLAAVEEAEEAIASIRGSLGEHTRNFDTYTRRMELLSDKLYNEVIASQMRPFSDGLYGFPRMIRDLARDTGKKVDFAVQGESTPVDRTILEKLEAPLTHILRNAVDHGLETPQERAASGKSETGRLDLSAHHRAGMLHIRVSDDGRGIDQERIRAKVVHRGLASAQMARSMSRAELMEFLFLPGFSTAKAVSEISGRGVGLDVVHSIIHSVGGSVRCQSEPGKGMTFTMQLPLTLSVLRTLLVDVGGDPLAVPLNRIDRVHRCPASEVRHVEDRQYVHLDGDNIGLLQARQVLDMQSDRDQDQNEEQDRICLLVISDRMHRYGLVVDGFLGERDLVVKPLDHRLGKVNNISSASVMDNGEPVLIADVDDLVQAMDRLIGKGRLSKVGSAEKTSPGKRVLVVDDSLTVREVQRRLLENNGYLVDTAVDGMDGLNALNTGHYDLVVTDVDMPRLSGIGLVERIRAEKATAALPVMIVSYKDREEDRLRGLEAGADYYLTKSSFHDDSLLDAVRDLIGEA